MYEGDSVYDTGCFKRIFKEHEYEFEYKNVPKSKMMRKDFFMF